MNEPATGFQFPGTVELTAFGEASEPLVEIVTAELIQAGVALDPDSTSTRASNGGRYLAVRVAFFAETRAHWQAAHARLREHAAIRWTM